MQEICQSRFFDIRGYFEISVFMISNTNCTSSYSNIYSDDSNNHILMFLILINICTCPGNTLEGDVIALDQLTSPFSPRKATRMSP